MDKNDKILMPRLVVALGGFGLLVWLYLKRMLLDRRGTIEPCRGLVIDTCEPESYLRLENPLLRLAEEEVTLVRPEWLVIDFVPDKFFDYGRHPDLDEVVPTDVRDVNTMAGARSIRALAHAAAVSHADAIERRLREAARGLFPADAPLAGDADARAAIQVAVPHSAAGATGSGTALFVGYLLRHLRHVEAFARDIDVTAYVGHADLWPSATARMHGNDAQYHAELQECMRPGATYKLPGGRGEIVGRPFDHVAVIDRTNGTVEFGSHRDAAELIAQHLYLDMIL